MYLLRKSSQMRDVLSPDQCFPAIDFTIMRAL